MEWFERWFGEEYLLVYEHRDDEEAERDIAFIGRLLDLKPGELVLDLCCGTGRHDIPLANLGCRVTGLDFSGDLLDIAVKNRTCVDPCPRYIRADARDTVFRDGAFDAVLNLFTSFGYFSDDDNSAFIHSIARLLKPAGRFYIDYLNPSRVLEGLVPESVKEKDGLHVIERREYDEAARRVNKTIILERGGITSEFSESVRLYSHSEMREMIHEAGLILNGVLSSSGGEPYSETGPRMILHGVKP